MKRWLGKRDGDAGMTGTATTMKLPVALCTLQRPKKEYLIAKDFAVGVELVEGNLIGVRVSTAAGAKTQLTASDFTHCITTFLDSILHN